MRTRARCVILTSALRVWGGAPYGGGYEITTLVHPSLSVSYRVGYVWRRMPPAAADSDYDGTALLTPILR